MWIDSGMEVDEHESGRREDVMGGREWRRPVGQQGTADAAGAGKSTGQCLLLGGNSAPLKPLPEPRQSAKLSAVEDSARKRCPAIVHHRRSQAAFSQISSDSIS